jgi:hypothetical protein
MGTNDLDLMLPKSKDIESSALISMGLRLTFGALELVSLLRQSSDYLRCSVQICPKAGSRAGGLGGQAESLIISYLGYAF